MNNYEPTHGWGPNINDVLRNGRRAWSDEYHESPHNDSIECCIVCGRRTGVDKGIAVVIGGGGDLLLCEADYAEAQEQDPGFVGAFLIGPECGKDIPTKFRADAEQLRW